MYRKSKIMLHRYRQPHSLRKNEDIYSDVEKDLTTRYDI